MNDKQQLAAMGAQYRLTEEQAKGLAERMPKTGALQVIDDEPLCMAKRIEELEAQVRVMAELLREAQECVVHDVVRGMGRDVESLWARIDATLAGNLPIQVTSEGWQLVPVNPTQEMVECGLMAAVYEGDSASCILASAYRAMLAAALSTEHLEVIQRNAAKPRATGRRITIERERSDVVYRSQCPYVGFTTITSKKNGSL